MRMKTASHNAVIYEQDIIDNHQLLLIKVPPLIDYEMFTDSHPYLIMAYIDMSTLFLLHTFQTLMVYSICHCSMSHVTCFNPGSSAFSHMLPRMSLWPLYTPPHTTCTSAYQDFSAKPVPVIHVVIHCTVCIWTSSLRVNSFRHFPVICNHELTCALWSLSVFVSAPQQVIRDSSAL